MTSNGLPPAAICAENVALLHLLTTVPVLPSRNPIENLPFNQENYYLSFKRERKLASTLSFLSHITDDSDHIPAVCIEESVQPKGRLTLLLAVNKLTQTQGDQLLRRIKEGWEAIFRRLARVSDDEQDDIEGDVFTLIMSLCSARIRSRLRFEGRKKSKAHISKVLLETIDAIKQLKWDRPDTELPYSNLYVKRAREVIRLVDAWTKHQTLSQLEQIIEGVSCLSKIGGLKALLDAIPDKLIVPSARKSVYNIIKKVARYREAAAFLYRTAKKWPRVRHMQVIIPRLPQQAFDRVPLNGYNPNLSSTLARLGPVYHQYDLGSICRLLKVNETQANNQFAYSTKTILEKSKFHAEIQLMYYLEGQMSRLPPRVVCSSKEACFLCSIFISSHGKIHTPGQHGKVYPNWRLPLLPKFNGLARKFNLALEIQIRDNLATLFSRRQRTRYPDPNESTLLTLMSTSTLPSVALSAVAPANSIQDMPMVHTKPSEASDSMESLSQLSETTASTSSDEHIENDDSSIEPTNAIIGCKENTGISSPNYTSSSLPSHSILSNHSSYSTENSLSFEDLIPGVAVSENLDSANKSRVYEASALWIQMEQEKEEIRDLSNSRLKGLPYEMEWLTKDATEQLLERSETIVIDVEGMEEGGQVLHELNDDNCLFIRARGSIVKISFESRAS